MYRILLCLFVCAGLNPAFAESESCEYVLKELAPKSSSTLLKRLDEIKNSTPIETVLFFQTTESPDEFAEESEAIFKSVKVLVDPTKPWASSEKYGWVATVYSTAEILVDLVRSKNVTFASIPAFEGQYVNGEVQAPKPTLTEENSPFLYRAEWVLENETMAALPSWYPIGPGHHLIVPKRVVRTYLDLTPEEQADANDLIRALAEKLEKELSMDGFNIAINTEHEGGQTKMHVHIHFIPRFAGDHPKPEGGIRGILPDQQSY